MLELYQFRHSPFCLKVRLALKAKKLTFKEIDVQPGIGQINIFKLSGQKKLPVLKDGENLIVDSTEIIKYLEDLQTAPSLFPNDSKEAATAQLLTDWADTTLAKSVKLELIKEATKNQSLREILLTEKLPTSIGNLINNLPYKYFNGIAENINKDESQRLLDNLKQLSSALTSHEYLVGQSLSIADLAIASQLSLLKFPYSSGNTLFNKGCKVFSDNPELKNLFEWRDKMEEKLLEVEPENF